MMLITQRMAICKFLAENFHVGDVVKLRINGEIHSLDKVIAFSQGSIPPQIELDNDFLFTVCWK